MNNSLIPENTAFAIALSGCQDPESRQCQQEKKLLWAPEIWGEHCARQRYGPSLHICYSSRFLGLQRSVLGWSRCCCWGFVVFCGRWGPGESWSGVQPAWHRRVRCQRAKSQPDKINLSKHFEYIHWSRKRLHRISFREKH